MDYEPNHPVWYRSDAEEMLREGIIDEQDLAEAEIIEDPEASKMTTEELQKLQELLEKYEDYNQKTEVKYINAEALDWHIGCVKQCARCHELEARQNG